MLTEDYCSKAVRNLLVTKGFIGDMWYNNDDIHISHALAMKWLREKYNIIIEIRLYNELYPFEFEPKIIIKNRENNYCKHKFIAVFSCYEEAVEAALKYCLENLL